MASEIILVGGGSHCNASIAVIESTNHHIKGILDKAPTQKAIFNYPVLGGDECIMDLIVQEYSFLITIGQIKNAEPRVSLFKMLELEGARLATVVASSAIVATQATIGDGTIVMHQALINAAAHVGRNCIINTKALIEHDAIIGNHTHVSTAAVVNGGCVIGERVFIGSGSIVCQGVHIGDDIVIGAGSVVIKPIATPGVYAGNPVRKIN